jgi:hypothetical protein
MMITVPGGSFLGSSDLSGFGFPGSSARAAASAIAAEIKVQRQRANQGMPTLGDVWTIEQLTVTERTSLIVREMSFEGVKS